MFLMNFGISLQGKKFLECMPNSIWNIGMLIHLFCRERWNYNVFLFLSFLFPTLCCKLFPRIHFRFMHLNRDKQTSLDIISAVGWDHMEFLLPILIILSNLPVYSMLYTCFVVENISESKFPRAKKTGLGRALFSCRLQPMLSFNHMNNLPRAAEITCMPNTCISVWLSLTLFDSRVKEMMPWLTIVFCFSFVCIYIPSVSAFH